MIILKWLVSIKAPPMILLTKTKLCPLLKIRIAEPNNIPIPSDRLTFLVKKDRIIAVSGTDKQNMISFEGI